MAPLCCLIWVTVLHQPIAHPWWWVTQPDRAVLLLLFYPLIEEVSFRGVVQGLLLEHSLGRVRIGVITSANLLTSLVFVAIHFVHHPPLWALAVWIPSLLFGYFREVFGGVIPSILLHAWYNAVFFSTVGHP